MERTPLARASEQGGGGDPTGKGERARGGAGGDGTPGLCD